MWGAGVLRLGYRNKIDLTLYEKLYSFPSFHLHNKGGGHTEKQENYRGLSAAVSVGLHIHNFSP